MLPKFPKQMLTAQLTADCAYSKRLLGLTGQYPTLGAKCYGVLDEPDMVSGDFAPYMSLGVAVLEAGEAITKGDAVIAGASGGKGAVMPAKHIYDKLAENLVWTSDTTLSDVFTFVAKPGAVYSGRIFMIGKNAATSAANIKYQFSLPTGSAIVVMKDGVEKDNSSVITEQLPANGVEEVIVLDVQITIGTTGGTVALQAAQSSSSADAISVMADSYINVDLDNTEDFNFVGVALTAAAADGDEFQIKL